MSKQAPTIVWLRQDLRVQDNPALSAAAAAGPVLPVYILDDTHPGSWAMGAASRWWLHQSLAALDRDLQHKLWVVAGDPLQLIPQLAAQHKARAVAWNRCYEPWRTQRDTRLRDSLRGQGLEVESCNGSLLWEPWTNLKQDGSPYKVFTPYYRNGLASMRVESELTLATDALQLAPCTQPAAKLDQLGLMPGINWYGGMEQAWTPGEQGAWQRLREFMDAGLADYKAGRDFPARRSVSRLSPHLHFGELSPRQVWHQAQQVAGIAGLETQAEHFIRELAWREFSYSLLYHFPHLTDHNLNSGFDAFPWRSDAASLKRWQRGETGYPLVDAGMRELWSTGYMHNRVRMIVASFLVKNLMIHWLEGAHWFWDCLVDADLANNSCSWQWVAGSGADAAPYFRIFNPLTQSIKFDPAAAYIRQHLPELARLPDKLIHDPSSAPPAALEAAGVKLDRDYPRAMVDLRESRERALAAYKSLRG